MADTIDFDPGGDVILLLPKKRDEEEVGAEAEIGTLTNDTLSKSTCTADGPSKVEDVPQADSIRMRVSSRHLALASTVFDHLLKGQFAESRALISAGTVQVPLPGDDAATLQIILNIVHGHLRKVPRDVDFAMLTQIAILTDKYCLHEVTEMFTDTWFAKLKASIPKIFNEELISWLCITWVLRKREAFKHSTRLMVQEGYTSFAKDTKSDLPIPVSVLGKSRFLSRLDS